MDNLLNVRQVAFILKVHPLTIRRYIKEGKLNAVKAGGNIRIKESELSKFNKDFSIAQREPSARSRFNPAKTFSLDDPFFRLKGRGAGVDFS